MDDDLGGDLGGGLGDDLGDGLGDNLGIPGALSHAQRHHNAPLAVDTTELFGWQHRRHE